MATERWKGFDLRAYAELARAPNLFTAVADIAAAWFVTSASFDSAGYVAPLGLLACSWCLYAGGVALNDYVDREVDARERPERPIPSGRVRPADALQFATAALLAGWMAGWIASAAHPQWRSGLAATALAAMVIGYDAWLKRTPLGPPAMGACRGLNWLLGMSLAVGGWRPAHGAIAGGVAVYITGVTWFARREAGGGSRRQLAAALAVMLAGLALVWHAVQLDAGLDRRAIYALAAPTRWALLIGLLAVFLARRAGIALWQPTPRHVQAAVKHAILSLLMLDAAVAWAFAGPLAAALVLGLLAPTIVLARFVSPT